MGLFDIFKSYNERELKKLRPTVDKINSLSDRFKSMSDEELKSQTLKFKDRLSQGETTDDILPEAFATVREAATRVLGQRHYDCQLIGGIILHQGRISEMKTGEGKTLVATLPAYLNALEGKGVHIVTVNDYLARRDSEWMGKIYTFLGLTVGLIVQGLEPEERRRAYAADITYGTNNEFGFDYLRDNMVIYKNQMVQRGHNFAIVDEVDSILIDEARTPLIISGHGESSDKMYTQASDFVKKLHCNKVKELEDKEEHDEMEGDYVVEEKTKEVFLTRKGMEKAQQAFGLENWTDAENTEIQHFVNQAMRAWGTMQRDVDYVIKDGQVIIVDEFTGRLMYGRRYSNGLHQSIEAKEGVNIQNESKTLATITFQNYFRIYTKLSGMTGTALTEESEFREIYSLDVIEIPTNRPVVRIDHNDQVFTTEAGKIAAVIEQIKRCNSKGQPVLVGTVTVEKSELLSRLLTREKIKHNVLNAKYHDKEASIVAQAGKFGAVTIATNMAGRGTDIILGGNPEYMAKSQMEKEGFEHEYIVASTGFSETTDEKILEARARYEELYRQYKPECDAEAEKVKQAGGLYILGTERHESRRIDNQLRGRSGRQGDVGESCFFISLQDDLMRLFGGEKVQTIATSMNLPENQPIDARILTSTIENAQKRVEGTNFQRRKRVLEYDDVINQQRKIIYDQRQMVLDGKDIKDKIMKMLDDTLTSSENEFMPGEDPAMWNISELRAKFRYFLLPTDLVYSEEEQSKLVKKDICAMLEEKAHAAYDATEKLNTPEIMRELERIVLLTTVDKYWMDHIDAMDDLRTGVSLRAYGSKDPLIEYKYEGFEMFEEMIRTIKEETSLNCLRVRAVNNMQRKQQAHIEEAKNAGAEKKAPVVKKTKIGPNDPCPCGSGLKYKKCCGKDR